MMRNTILALALVTMALGCGEKKEEGTGPAYPVERGELSTGIRGNAPRGNSGLVWLRDRTAGNEAFRNSKPISSGGLNYEHVISGIASPNNYMTPRMGPFTMTPLEDGATLERYPGDDPWKLRATMSYRVVAPSSVDFEFRATITDASLFGAPGFVSFFFANYMAGAQDPELNFKGFSGPGAPESWVRSVPRYPGDHYAPLGVPALEAAKGDDLAALNLGQEEWPRIAKPFFYGRAHGDMVFALYLDRLQGPEEEIRFTIMRWDANAPAWDFSYAARKLHDGKRVGFRGRAVWKSFVSSADVERDYLAWSSSLPAWNP